MSGAPHDAPLMGPFPRDAALATAAGASVALAATLLVAPWGPWLAPVGLLGGIWAPGYAILRVVYPRGRLSLLERNALAAAVGLLLLPVAVVSLSLARRFSPRTLGILLLAVTLAFCLLALLRYDRRGWDEDEEKPARAPLPDTRTTLLLSGVAIVAAMLLLAPTFLGAVPEPPALAVTMDGGAPLPLQAPVGEVIKARLVVMAGDAPAQGHLVATWGNVTLADMPIDLRPGDVLDLPLDLPVESRGAHVLQAHWDGPGREVHATIQGVRK